MLMLVKFNSMMIMKLFRLDSNKMFKDNMNSLIDLIYRKLKLERFRMKSLFLHFSNLIYLIRRRDLWVNFKVNKSLKKELSWKNLIMFREICQLRQLLELLRNQLKLLQELYRDQLRLLLESFRIKEIMFIRLNKLLKKKLMSIQFKKENICMNNSKRNDINFYYF